MRKAIRITALIMVLCTALWAVMPAESLFCNAAEAKEILSEPEVSGEIPMESGEIPMEPAESLADSDEDLADQTISPADQTISPAEPEDNPEGPVEGPSDPAETPAEPEIVPVQAITISGPERVKIKKKIQLTATVEPAEANQEVVWESSKPFVARVNKNGVVKGIKRGKAKITATAADGSGAVGIWKIRVYRIGKEETRWVAHRGLHVGAKENTAKAFKKAGKEGFWGCECDIWETAHTTGDDGRDSFDIVINHDETFGRVFGVYRNVRNMTASEIKSDSRLSKVCFFKKYLNICHKYDMVPVIELKDPYMSQECLHKVIRMVYKIDNGITLKSARLYSFYSGVLSRAARYAEKKYNIRPATGYYISYTNWGSGISAFKTANRKGFTGVSVNRDLMNSHYRNYCRNHGLRISLWEYWNTKNSKNHLYKDLKKYKPYNVIVNAVVFE